MRSACIAFVGLILCIPDAAAQDAKESLKDLEKCGNDEVRSAVKLLRRGLVDHRWVKNNEQRNAKLPSEYLENLGMMATACRNGQATYSAISNDLKSKIEDCRHYGMGRLVPVQIQTLKESKSVDLWEVFYEWVSGRNDTGNEMRVPGMTPCTLKLPPGIYLFQARKNEASSPKMRLPVAGEDTILVQISVP